jgi:hypothetical protein
MFVIQRDTAGFPHQRATANAEKFGQRFRRAWYAPDVSDVPGGLATPTQAFQWPLEFNKLIVHLLSPVAAQQNRWAPSGDTRKPESTAYGFKSAVKHVRGAKVVASV